jgi:hypothetical protein
VFTALTIQIAHDFWNRQSHEALIEFRHRACGVDRRPDNGGDPVMAFKTQRRLTASNARSKKWRHIRRHFYIAEKITL